MWHRDGTVEPLTDAITRPALQNIYDAQSAEGFRTLAVCYRCLAGSAGWLFTISDEKDMILVGLVTFIDPPKESAGDSDRLLAQSGIESRRS